MKVAIIGAGFISGFHADAYRETEDVQLAAVCDTDIEKANRLAAQMDCLAYSDAQTMLLEIKPDIVSICLPSFLHEQYTIMALKNGAHVLCEKPLSLTMESCERMAEAAARNHRILMAAQVVRWWPEYQTIAREIRRLGNPISVSTQRLQYAKNIRWIADPELGGGVLFDLFVHDLDFLCSLFGSCPSVESAYGAKGKEGSWRTLCSMLRWSSGVHAKIEASNLMPPGFPFTANLRADYPEQCVCYSFHAPINIQKDAKTDTEFLLFDEGKVLPLETVPAAQSVAFQQEIKAFVKGVETGKTPLPIEETLQIMKVIHQVKDHLSI